MIDVIRFINSRFTSNTYVIFSTDSEDIWVIDPGDFNIVEKWMQRNSKKRIAGVLITHAHFDHIYGANDIYEKYPSTPFFVNNQTGVEILYDSKRNGSKYTESPFVLNEHAKVFMVSQEMILWNECKIHIYHTPGHSEDSMCILLNNILFTGDTLIKDIRTVTKLKGGSVEKLQESINLLKTLKGRGIVVYGGHEDSFELDNYDLSIATTNKLHSSPNISIPQKTNRYN